MLLAHCSFTDKLSVLSEPRHAKGSVVTTILKVLCIYQVYLAFLVLLFGIFKGWSVLFCLWVPGNLVQV